MKNLFLIRHAKSSWKDETLRDFDRPLNKRGERDAPFMAEVLQKKNLIPDVILSSPARRAITTAEIFASKLNYPADKIIHDEELYMAGKLDLFKVIKKIPDNAENVMLFAHNPGLTIFSNYISDNKLENIPTCGIVKLQLLKDSWIDLEEEGCRLEFFEYPKKYLAD